MGLISRVSAFINGTPNDGTAVDAEFENFRTTLNGNLDNANISASAAIAATKVDPIPPARVLDHADSETEYKTMTTPGDTGTPSLPSTLEEELERLRYRIGANRGYLTSSYMDNSGPTVTSNSWTEPAIVGPNLLPNPGFELQTGGAGTAPDGWTLVGTPSTVAIENPAHTGTGLEKRSLNIVTDAANEGLSVAVAGLKTGVKYLVGMAYSITDNGTTPGTVRISTSGGLASGDYQNLILTDGTEASTTVSILQGLVKPTTTPGTITVSIDATQSGADFNLHEVWMYEVADGKPVDLPSIPTQTARDITASTFPTTWTGTGSTWRTDTLTSLSLSQYVPYRGYRFTYEVSLPYSSVDSSASREAARVYAAIQLNIDGGGANTVAGPVIMEIRSASSDMRDSGTLFLKYVVDNPTPGSTYAFTTLLGVYDASDFEQISLPPVVDTVQMAAEARLIVERI